MQITAQIKIIFTGCQPLTGGIADQFKLGKRDGIATAQKHVRHENSDWYKGERNPVRAFFKVSKTE